ncbi:MAG: MATE family efflux transporter [Lachnospiraceae bacterium]|nr:MATE family efflux transporter [Lachnospiraceae bacterium]
MKNKAVNLLEGSIAKGIISFCIPLFVGQLLQQLYNIADAWVVGNFAEHNAFAAVSSGGSLCFFVVGFFGGLGAGGGIVISRYFGAGDEENLRGAIHGNVLFALICCVLATAAGLYLIPKMLLLVDTPPEVLPYSLQYFTIFFGGISTMILYNTFMNIMRSLGDSYHPLLYLLFSSLLNIGLDLLFVAVFGFGAKGAAYATIIAQAVSALLCFVRLLRMPGSTRVVPREIFRWNGRIMKQIVLQGLPMGVQNSVISIGNIVVQKNINSFGASAMSGMGAYFKLEGFVFLPINAISMGIPTFISQNLGARKYDRAKKGARFGILTGVLTAELIGLLFLLVAEQSIRFFVNDPAAIEFGRMHVGVVTFFYGLLAYSHCAAGVMRGAGKPIVPMITMLTFWCGVRVIYVTTAIHFVPKLTTVSWCYPITWSCSSIVFTLWLLLRDWTHAYETQAQGG